MRIAFIGYGEAAQAFTDSLSAKEPQHERIEFAAYDILFSEGGRPRAEAGRRAVRACSDTAQAVTGADWIISAVTAASARDAAEAASRAIASHQAFIGINSVSPATKRANAALIADHGAVYVDMAVMAPVHPRGHRTPVLMAGQAPDYLREDIAALGFAGDWIGDEPGAATAVKMARSLFVKGLEAISVETLRAAHAMGCRRPSAKATPGSIGIGCPDTT